MTLLKFNQQIGLISLFAGSLSLIATSAVPSQASVPASEPAQTTIAQPRSEMSQINSVAELSNGSTSSMAQ
ncbi:MAG: hypothetical protein C4287_21325, partial [Leptolyngbya sp. ERB_1_2]